MATTTLPTSLLTPEGTSGHVLTSNGTGSPPTYQAAAGGGGSGITEGTEQASTSGTAINFTSIPSGTKRITIMLDSVSTNGTSGLILQIGDSGGYETSGYDAFTGGGAEGNVCRVDPFTSSFGLFDPGRGLALNSVRGAVVLTRMNSSSNKWNANGNVSIDATIDASYDITGVKSLSAELDRLRITTVGGTDTFDAGNINISYE